MLPANAGPPARAVMTRAFALTAILLLFPHVRASAQALSLDSCQALARANYPLVRQYGLIEKTREFTLDNAGSAYLPQLKLTGIGAYIFGDLPSINAPGNASESTKDLQFIGLAQLNQSIWDGGATGAQKDVIRATAETDKASLEVVLYELRARVNQLYFGILLVDEQLKQLVAQDAILRNNAERVRLLTENGLAFTTDLDEIKVEQLQLEQRRVELRHVRRGYTRVLSLMIGREIGDDATLERPAVANQDPELTIARPELSLFASQRSLVDAQYSVNHSSLMPRVGLLGAAALIEPGIGLGSQKINWIGVAGLSVSWSIGGLYRNGNDKGLADASRDRIGLQEETFRFETSLAVTQASANIEKLRAILAGDDAIVQLRQRIRESYQLKYDNGAAPLVDLLNATEQETAARSQQALHDMQLLAALVERQTLTGHQAP